MKKSCLSLFLFVCVATVGYAQIRFPWQRKSPVQKTVPVAPVPPSQNPSQKADPNAPKPFSEVVTKDASRSQGLFTIYRQNRSIFMEIPDSIIGRDILIVSRISQAAADNRGKRAPVGYAGDQINRRLVRFEQRQNKLDLRELSFSERSNDTLGMYQAVKNSNVLPIVLSLDVKAFRAGKHPVIDITNLVEGDNSLLFFNRDYKQVLSVGGFQPDRSYVDTIMAFPSNVEIKTIKTYSVSGDSRIPALTYGLNTSFVLLPKEPMRGRIMDPRVGYFSLSFTDFDVNPQGVEQVSYITRWRLEPKPSDVEKYLAGELVEPQKPIVFYIDPATPKKWVPYLKAGVDDWQKAFEQAGFKNAIYAKEVDPADSTWSLEDARHSAIVYKPSTIPNASGPHVADPRSGEIIESHINWYHNVMLLLRNWYFIQASPLDKRAQKLQFDDELMGELIRFVSSHEVGHTLGLRHNFGSSATVPVENLRNKKWVEENGHTPSIMDYARFNYVAQPQDSISDKGIFPRIGMYDKWAIEWGYKWYPNSETPQEEAAQLSLLVSERLAKDPRYRFGHERDPDDPRSQNEDLGDNSVKASEYGIKNLQRIIPNLLSWTYSPTSNYKDTQAMYKEIIQQYQRYMGHVAKNVGGIYTTATRVEDRIPSKEFTPAARQREAMKFFAKELFETPTWLINKELIAEAGINPYPLISKVQTTTLARLQAYTTIDKLTLFEQMEGAKAYTPIQLYNDLRRSIWSGLTNTKKMDLYRRGLQKAYIANLKSMLDTHIIAGKAGAPSQEASALARYELSRIEQMIKTALPSTNGMIRAHLEDCLAQITEALQTK